MYSLFVSFGLMSSVFILFHSICDSFHIEKEFFGKYSVSLTRGFLSTMIAYEAYDVLSSSSGALYDAPYDALYDGKSSSNISYQRSIDYFLMYLSYIVYDMTLILFQNIYHAEIKYSIEYYTSQWILLSLMILLNYNRAYSLTYYLGLSQGIYVISGLELCFKKFNSSIGVSICHLYSYVYRLYRMLYIFPSFLIYFNHYDIYLNNPEKSNDQLLLPYLFIFYILYRYEFYWLNHVEYINV